MITLTKLKNWITTYPNEQFMHRKVAGIAMVLLATIYVLSPAVYQTVFFPTFVISTLMWVILFIPFMYARFRVFYKRNVMRHTFRNYTIDELEPTLQNLIQTWTAQLGRSARIRLTDSTTSLQSKPFQKRMDINPNYLRKTTAGDANASFYHELGHISYAFPYLMDTIVIALMSAMYLHLTGQISILRGEIPIVSSIATLALVRLLRTWVNWRNEYRVDKFAADKTDLQSMKQFFDSMKIRADTESHPSPNKRWKKVQDYLDKKAAIKQE